MSKKFSHIYRTKVVRNIAPIMLGKAGKWGVCKAAFYGMGGAVVMMGNPVDIYCTNRTTWDWTVDMTRMDYR